MASPTRQRNLPRSEGVIRRQGPDSNARRAAATARLISSRSLSGTRAITEASAGLKTSKVLPETAGTHWPPIRLFFFRLNQEAMEELTFGATAFEAAVARLLPPLPPAL